MESAILEQLLVELDTSGAIFPEFELYKVNGQLQLLGRGGFSQVYEMRCKEKAGRRYALKVIGLEKHVVTSQRFWESVRLQRYLAEKSPFVVRIIDAKEIVVELNNSGELTGVNETVTERWQESGLILQFLLMEKYEEILQRDRFGKALLLRNDLQKEGGVLSFAMQIGQVLHLAHQNNILHRDIKLENVYWDEKEQMYKLGDFGIARFVESGNAETVVYTDGYGAPEIERHLGQNYDATADIYSFGITLYLLLNNLRFPGSQGYCVNLVQYHPEFVFPAPINASEAMSCVLRKMCSYNKEERYQSIAEMLMDLSYLIEKQEQITQETMPDIPDFPTETFRDGKELLGDRNVTSDSSRVKRKKEEVVNNKKYNRGCLKYFLGFVIILVPILFGLQTEVYGNFGWQAWMLPIATLVQALCLRQKEFYILASAVTLGLILYSVSITGLSTFQVILFLCVISGSAVFSAASAVACSIWMSIVQFSQMLWPEYIVRYDLGWIFLIIFFAVFQMFFIFSVECQKISNIRAFVGIWIFDKLYLVMMAIGLALWILQRYEVIVLPESIERLHLIRVGAISYIAMLLYLKWRGYLEDKDEFYMDEENQG